MINSISEASRACVAIRSIPAASVEITADVYHEAINALPPYCWQGNRFWLGEPYDDDPVTFKATALECWKDCGKYFCRLSIIGGKS